MTMIFVKPKPGLQVRNPDTGYSPLPEGGVDVIDSPYWRQHERQGSIEIVAQPTPGGVIASSPPSGNLM